MAFFDCGVHLLNGDHPGELGHAAFKLRCPNLRKKDNGAVGLKEKFEPIAWLEFQVLSHKLRNGDLVFATEGGLHGLIPPLYILSNVKRTTSFDLPKASGI
jgi:hypothetical protein